MERNLHLPRKPQHELAGCSVPPREGLSVRVWSEGFEHAAERTWHLQGQLCNNGGGGLMEHLLYAGSQEP